MNRETQDNFRIAEEAALWLHRLDKDDSPECRAAFDRWVREGATHLEEFLFAQTVWKQLDHLGEAHRASVMPSGADAVVSFPGKRGHAEAGAPHVREPRRNRRWLFAAAAGLASIATAGLWIQQTTAPAASQRIYATETGSQETVKLADGSMVHLNTRSQVEVRYSTGQRAIHLKAGEALFTVAKDTSRPFVVITGDASIRALGTQFNVHRSTGITRIAVTEGAVEVTNATGTLQLKAGESAEVRGASLEKSAHPDIDRAVAWRARRLVFPGDRVADIAAEFNRYNTVQIRVEGRELQDHLMSGVFDADNPDTWLDFLARNRGVSIDRTTDLIVIH